MQKESSAEQIKKKNLQIGQCLPKLRRFMSLKNEQFLLLRCDIHIAALNSKANLQRKFHLLKY